MTHNPTNPILRLHNVHYEVSSAASSLAILKGCELEVEPQQSLAIVGRSGSGKSTLLALMAGLDTATRGDVQLLSHNLSQLNEDQRAQVRAQSVGFVFQNFQLMSGLTALENVMMPLELFNLDQPKQRAEAALESVGLSHRLHHRPQSLSGGEQQRVAIARALVTQPKILFADEPTGNLDETTANQVQDLLFQLQDHTTLILVTHDVDYAARCQRQVRLEHGQLIEDTVCR
ncbi:ABC transporter ATP-binding protein [Thiomicrospira cyclica]|uniref:Phosphonate-transporting ATPase n=1 Tax=Thiomicrospira cyclica (strain DSM 14477 / JCM 11371 / ALM1) TaxID=717773 RepID=F6D8I3_THICA|nr:ATP-binding cassette domain-containing protein [Thiomicrospira cyclica]AEG31834.1 Phosphonate-transporting ATPase [Thiomicrospira cyclica ALM1]